MDYIQGSNRDQILLFPDAIDDFISPENPVRFIEAFVDSLNLQELDFRSAILSETGRPPYHPGDFLKLYLYGYLNAVRSSRRLEKESQRNLELMWLLKKLTPDFKTIADFRKNNTEALKGVCREFTLLCKDQDLFGGELVAIDGSKFLAVNANFRNFTHRRLKRALDHINEKVAGYLRDLDVHDQKEAPREKKGTVEELRKKIKMLKDRRKLYESKRKEMEISGENQVSLTDPESRSMMVGVGTDVAYNVQAAVDEKHHLIVDHEVVNNPTDQNELAPMAGRAKETLGVEKLKVVADRGYYHGDHIKTCEEKGIMVYTDKPETSANRKHGLFPKDVFIYDKRKDRYRCPAGKELTYRFDSLELDRHIRYYVGTGCRGCPLKSKCTRSQSSRKISRWIHEEVLERMKKRVREHPDIMKKRREIVEHPFGTMKRWMDQGFFLMRGLPKVRAEASLTVFSYNLKRAMNVLGVPKLISAVG
jgi:transposase